MRTWFIRTPLHLTLALVIAAIALFSCAAAFFLPEAAAQSGTGKNSVTSPAHDPDDPSRYRHSPFSGKDWNDDQIWKEKLIRHQLNKRPAGSNESAAGSTASNTDINDISVIQDDGSLVIPQKFFDLSGHAVQFTPSGAGYTISSPSLSFDTSTGSKLDLTFAPAVNPKIAGDPNVEAGDDAYLTQDLGFSFPYYGTSFTTVAISSNGNLVFRPAGTANQAFDDGAVDSGESLAKLQSGLPRIAPYWHDLDARSIVTQGSNGIFIRKDSDKVLITFNNIRDFPNRPSRDTGIHTFQVTLFKDGRILFGYNAVALTSTAVAGIGPGNSTQIPSLVDLSIPPAGAFNNAIVELFSLTASLDEVAVVKAFYTTHPNRDVYDFVYIFLDFDFDLNGAFAFYLPIRNDTSGIGLTAGDGDPGGLFTGSLKMQGLMNLNNINTAYPDSPVARFFGADSALSIFGQEQGHRWLASLQYPGTNSTLLLGRANQHWSYFLSIPSTMSSPAALRSSSMEGSVWRDNGNGTFTTVNLVDGYSRLDQYVMGLRPASDVPAAGQEMFVVGNPTGTNRTSSSSPQPNVTAAGTKQPITIDQIIQKNGARNPDSTTAPKNFRAAMVLLTRQGTTPAAATINKLTRFRFAWESYFAYSTDYKGSINTGLADPPPNTSRVIAAVSAASYATTLTPGGISALFGSGVTAGGTEAATSQPLPTTLAGTQVLIDGTPAPLFFAAPTQINFQVPKVTQATTTTFFPAIPSTTALIEVFSNGQLIRAGAVHIAPAVPSVFTLNQSGNGAAVAIDGINFTGAPFAARQTNGQPNIIAVFASGLGADATDADGNVNGSVQATFDGNATTVAYAGRAPGFTGLNQFNLNLPANITSGNHTLVISRNGIQSNPTTIAIK